MATQNVVNLNQSYFPMYLTETLHFNKVYHYLKYIYLNFSSLKVRVFLCPASEQAVFFAPCTVLFDWESKRRSGEVLTLQVPIVTKINFLLTISIHCQEISYEN